MNVPSFLDNGILNSSIAILQVFDFVPEAQGIQVAREPGCDDRQPASKRHLLQKVKTVLNFSTDLNVRYSRRGDFRTGCGDNNRPGHLEQTNLCSEESRFKCMIPLFFEERREGESWGGVCGVRLEVPGTLRDTFSLV
ncbi:LOW QUALITY PROTEIN: hypothetical protein BC936DRAFT_146788 [Jimgerdemannia flammicorona]|uniref:Uncharacterized protein n=1 Tax=Jimgerdemannia flammicorona TaxID=994334 RepID=A0A433D6W5_9FUNG|nr:LOW QUALITY PROTEIN: hypothetical protein BC936DRAFT_146788 [Jimgerdemannia flammicorona]